MEERRRQRQGNDRARTESAREDRPAEPHQDDADVLHAVVRKQTLQVMLHQRIEHAQHR